MTDTTNARPAPPSVPAPLEVGCSPSIADPSSILHPPSSPPGFPRRPGETPRAFSAFLAFFGLGHARSLQAVADKLGENLGTVKNWSSKYDWAERLQTFNSGLLQTQARDQAACQRQEAADWNRRLHAFREQEWEAAQKLIAAAQCFLETFGEDDVRRMTLAQVSRALKVSSTIARAALVGVELPASSEPDLSPLQQQLLAGVTRVYGPPSPSSTRGASPKPQNLDPAT